MFGLDTLNTIYLALTIAGLVYALGMLFLSDMGGDHAADVGGDVSIDVSDVNGGIMGDADLQIFSPITAATFVTVFGASGLITTLGFGLEDRFSLVVAALSGGLVSLFVAFVYSRLLVEMHGTTEIRQSDMIGMVGQVVTPIPADGLGEVLYEIGGQRGRGAARSSNQTPIPRGATVVVDEIVGAVLIVKLRQPNR